MAITYALKRENGEDRERGKNWWEELEARGGGDSAYERDGDARRLASGCKFRILVSLRVFWGKRHHI